MFPEINTTTLPSHDTTAFYGHSLMFRHFSEILSYSSVLCLENLPYSLSGVCFSITIRMWFIHEEWNWLVGDKRLHTPSLSLSLSFPLLFLFSPLPSKECALFCYEQQKWQVLRDRRGKHSLTFSTMQLTERAQEWPYTDTQHSLRCSAIAMLF